MRTGWRSPSPAASRKLPMSLRTIFKSLENDTGIGPPQHGDLTGWAHNGVLLLNTSLTVEAGKANSHRKAGWQELAAEVMAFLNAQPGPVVFMLWGNQAQEAGKAIDRNRHCVIETAHPSPLRMGAGRNTGSLQHNRSGKPQTGFSNETCQQLTGSCHVVLLRTDCWCD
jgi:uracil-DNA glycosylase